MRDFRDAKGMAQALRDALKAKAVETTHSECLELIAKAFGYDNWNILSAKIDTARSHQPGAPAPSPAQAGDPSAQSPLSCSFCGKSQHGVRVLIAGPSSYICDECVDICNDVVDDRDTQEILGLLKADEESGDRAYPVAFERIRGQSAEDVTSYAERSRKGAERHRLLLHHIQRGLAIREGEEVPAEGEIPVPPRFAHLKDKTRDALLAQQQHADRELKRYEATLRIALTVLGERGQRD